MRTLLKLAGGLILLLALLGCVDTTGVYEKCTPETEQKMDVYDAVRDTVYEDLATVYYKTCKPDWYVLP